MKKIIFLLTFLSCFYPIKAQDIHFAQSIQTPLFINPAACGVFNGWERVIINYRNQWLGSATQFQTTAISADVNLFKNKYNDRPYIGVGLQFFNDIGGDSKFGNQTGSLTISGVLPFGRTGHMLSVGIQGGIGSRKASLDNVHFLSQWNGTNFDPTLFGESEIASFNYIDASTGIYYIYDGGQNTFQRNNDFTLKIGASVFHVNQPELTFAGGTADRLHRKYVANIDIVKDIYNSPFAMDISALQFIQGKHTETLLGFILRYRFINGTKITGFSQDAYFGFGTYYRHKDAVIPAIMIDWNGFQFGMTYDFTISELRKAYGGGSLEFSLSYVNRHHALFKTKQRRF